MNPKLDTPANAEAPAAPTSGAIEAGPPSAPLGGGTQGDTQPGGATASVMADAGQNAAAADPVGGRDCALPLVGGPGADADMIGDAEEDDDDAPQKDNQQDGGKGPVDDAMQVDEGGDGGDSAARPAAQSAEGVAKAPEAAAQATGGAAGVAAAGASERRAADNDLNAREAADGDAQTMDVAHDDNGDDAPLPGAPSATQGLVAAPLAPKMLSNAAPAAAAASASAAIADPAAIKDEPAAAAAATGEAPNQQDAYPRERLVEKITEAARQGVLPWEQSFFLIKNMADTPRPESHFQAGMTFLEKPKRARAVSTDAFQPIGGAEAWLDVPPACPLLRRRVGRIEPAAASPLAAEGATGGGASAAAAAGSAPPGEQQPALAPKKALVYVEYTALIPGGKEEDTARSVFN